MPRFWIRVNARLSDDPEVIAFADALFPKQPTWLAVRAACGLLVTLWGHVVDEQEDGDVSARSDTVLETWAGWGGKRSAFAVAFRARFVDEAGKIRQWDEYQGALIERREKDRVRKRRKDSSGVPAEIRTPSSCNVNGHGQALLSTPNGVEREEPTPTVDPALAGAAPVDVGVTSGAGDYQDAPRNREAMLRAGRRLDPDAPRLEPTPLAESVDAIEERQHAYRAELEASASEWMHQHPDETKAIGAEERRVAGLPLNVKPSDFAAVALRGCVIERIRQRLGWPTLETWDGQAFAVEVAA